MNTKIIMLLLLSLGMNIAQAKPTINKNPAPLCTRGQAVIDNEPPTKIVATSVSADMGDFNWGDSDNSSKKRPYVLLENAILKFYFAETGADIPDYDFSQALYLVDNVAQGKNLGIMTYKNPNDKQPFNMKLAKKRASAVKKFLLKNGVPASQIFLMKPIENTEENSFQLFEVDVIGDK